MPAQRAMPTSRRHAELLQHLVQAGTGAAVKDLRLRRVVPPTSSPLNSSPDCADDAKPGSTLLGTPPAPTPHDREERKPAMLPRSKLVRDPASFGYRRLLPFLNELANDDTSESDGKEDNSSMPHLLSESDPVDSAGGGSQETKNCSDDAKEDTSTGDLSSTKPCLSRCARSRFVHHPSSFSYKRMLPFLMDSERVKIRRVVEEKQSAAVENDVMSILRHHAEYSPEEGNSTQAGSILEEKLSESDGNCGLDGGLLHPAVSEASHLEGSAAVVQKLTEKEVLASDGHLLSSDKGQFTSDENDVMADGHPQLAVTEDSTQVSNEAKVERTLEEKELLSDGNFVPDDRQLQPLASELSPPEGITTEMQEAKQKHASTSDGDMDSPLTLDKGRSVAKDQSLLYASVTEELAVKASAECDEVKHCLGSESGCSDVGFGAPTKIVTPLVNVHGVLERQDSVNCLDDPLLDVVSRPSDLCAIGTPLAVEEMPAGDLQASDPCAMGTPLAVEEMSGSVLNIEPVSSKVGTLRPRGSPCLEKRGLSSKKLSPKKGILKKQTRGCKGICMCLDCSTFRLHSDRAFEFSRKQMHEADDIIDNLLKEVASLRNLMEKSAAREPTQAACQRASRVEEVARERRRQMLMELNAHCRIPGPRVKFAQYVEERMAASPPPRSRK